MKYLFIAFIFSFLTPELLKYNESKKGIQFKNKYQLKSGSKLSR